MPTRTSSLLSLIVFVAFAAIAVVVVLASRQERPSVNLQEENDSRKRARIERMERDVNTLPEAVYETVEGPDWQLRKLKSRRYDAGNKPFEDLENGTEKTKLYCAWGAPELEPFPAQESTAIVIGTVTDAKGYISEDKTAAYSEYAVNVTEILKDGEKLKGRSIIAEREGAKVVLSDGRRYRYSVLNQGTPQKGHRYMFFLKDAPEGKDYFVLTGYELLNGRVTPLDSISGKYESFDGADENAFIEIVRLSAK